MTEDRVGAYVQGIVTEVIGLDAGLDALVLIGSRVYEEFARPDSDFDLLAIHDKANSAAPAFTVLDHGILGGLTAVPVECRLFSRQQFRRYVFDCDLVKQFAFVRGYTIAMDNHGIAGEGIELCLSRYWTGSYDLYCELKQVDFAKKLLAMRYQMSDSRNYFGGARLRTHKALRLLRLAEVVKQFLVQVWTLECIELVREDPLDGMQIGHPSLANIGLLRVFASPNGGRIIDREKYSLPDSIGAYIAQLDDAIESGEAAVFAAMSGICLQRFGVPLYFDGGSSERLLWP